MTRPNTATFQRSCEELNNGAKKKLVKAQQQNRPRSAAVVQTTNGQFMQVKSIADIVKQNASKTASTTDLIKEFENEIRKAVELKRTECDKLQFALAKQKVELDKEKLVLADLRKESEALGLDKYPENKERLQPVASVSRKLLFSKHTKIDELEAQLEEKSKAIQEILRKSLVYENMKKRLMGDIREALERNSELKAKLAEKNQSIDEQQKSVIIVEESINQIQSKLAQLKTDVAAEIRTWEREYSYRQQWAKEKAKFQKFYIKQTGDVDVSQDITDDDSKKPKIKEKSDLHSKFVASKLASKHYERKYEKQLEDGKIKEKMYEECFRSIGIQTRSIDADEIIKVCMQHKDLKQSLLKSQEEEIMQQKRLHDKIENTKKYIQQNAHGRTRADVRSEEAKQNILENARHNLLKAKNEYQSLKKIVDPLKIGIEHLIQSVLNEHVEGNGMEVLEFYLGKVDLALHQFVAKKVASTDEGKTPAAIETAKKQIISAVEPDDIISNNVRVVLNNDTPDLSREAPATNLPPATIKHNRHANKWGSGLESYVIDECNDEGFVMDRTTVKKISSNILAASNTKKQRNNTSGEVNWT